MKAYKPKNDMSLPIYTLGVTGGIGSGKTLVCEMLAALGARVLHADDEARRLMVENKEVRNEIIAAFGEESYLENGTLNRGHLAQIVFGNDKEIARINSIVHPRMADVFYEAKARAQREGMPLLIYEAALIYESGSADRLDAVAVVHTPAEVRLKRVIQRDGVTAEQVKSRMRHQLPPEELLERADFVVVNDSSVEVLESRVRELYDEVCLLRQGTMSRRDDEPKKRGVDDGYGQS